MTLVSCPVYTLYSNPQVLIAALFMLLSECECMTALCQCVTFVVPLRDMCYYCVTRSYRAHYIRDIVTS